MESAAGFLDTSCGFTKADLIAGWLRLRNGRACLVHLIGTTVMAVKADQFPRDSGGEPVDSHRIAVLQRMEYQVSGPRRVRIAPDESESQTSLVVGVRVVRGIDLERLPRPGVGVLVWVLRWRLRRGVDLRGPADHPDAGRVWASRGVRVADDGRFGVQQLRCGRVRFVLVLHHLVRRTPFGRMSTGSRPDREWEVPHPGRAQRSVEEEDLRPG